MSKSKYFIMCDSAMPLPFAIMTYVCVMMTMMPMTDDDTDTMYDIYICVMYSIPTHIGLTRSSARY